MNEFEQQLVDKVLEGIHEVEKEVIQKVGELKEAISTLGQKSQSEHIALRETVERSIETDTDRLNKHSEEIDDLNERTAKLEEWKDQFEKSVANRIAVSQSITTVVAVVIAFLLSKFLGG